MNRFRLTIAVAFGFLLFGLSACGGGGSSDGGTTTKPPEITAQPASLTVNSGESATFTVAATGATSYQWLRNGVGIPGATASSYTVSPATAMNNGDTYAVVAENAGGNTNSSVASLRVTGISVLAGQIGGEGYADGDASQARFWGPAALALDTAGNLYVADFNAIRKVTPAGVVSTVVGSPRECGEQAGVGSAALLCYPYALALDAADNLYVADYAGTTVWRIDAGASMSAYSTSFSCIESLAVSGVLLYVGDSCGIGAIKSLSTMSAGAPSVVTSIAGLIAGLSFDQNQNLYIANDTFIQELSGGVVSTLAGAPAVYGSADGQGTAAQFGCRLSYFGANYYGSWGAVAIAALPSGNSYVADYCNDAIRLVTPAGNVTTFAGSAGMIGTQNGTGTSARFFGPSGLVIDPAGNVLVADYNSGLIRKITPAGVVSTYAGQSPHMGHTDGPAAEATFCAPYGVVADSAGNLYVSDTYNYVIRKITPAGVVSTLAGTVGVPGSTDGTGSGAKFNLPQGIAIDGSGNLYVADSLNRAVRKVTPEGVVSTFAVTFVLPSGVAVDAAGDVYVTDRKGVYEVVPGVSFTKIATLNNATAVVAAPDGTVYVTASSGLGLNAGAVYSLSADHQLTPLVSTGLSYRLPGIVMGGDGNLYVSDLGNSVIKKVTAAGVVTTVAGTPDLPIGTVPGGLPGKMNSPTGLALLSTGTSVSLAVVDSFEQAILRLDLP